MTEWVAGKIIENHHWTDQLYSLKIDTKIDPFTAGQFCRLALDIDGERVARPYSLVNSPTDPYLEFYSIIVPDGPLSTKLHQLKPNDDVWVTKKAAGFFTIHEVPSAKHLWLLSTGTAVGPFISILKTDEPWQRFDKIILVHAVRHTNELSYQDTINEVQQTHAGKLEYVPFVSRDKTDFAIHGRIPAAIRNSKLEEKIGINMAVDNSQIMLCGNPGMITDTMTVLQERGFKKNLRRNPGHITTEKYW